MATTNATGSGPIEFTSSTGKLISIPLAAFSFDTSNNLVVDTNWQTIAKAAPASAYLAYAVKEGVLAPAVLASPIPAMTIRAADAGTAGNNISVTIDHPATTVTDLTKIPFDVTVTEKETYTGLTTATIEKVLGSSAATGSSPGLVQVVAGSVVADSEPGAQTGQLAGSPPQLNIYEAGSPAVVAFTLAAKKAATSATLTKVVVTPDVTSPPAANPTFTLVATWSTMVSGVTLASLSSLTSGDLPYEVTVSPPASGAYSVPAAGTTQLSGGTATVNASAMLFAG